MSKIKQQNNKPMITRCAGCFDERSSHPFIAFDKAFIVSLVGYKRMPNGIVAEKAEDVYLCERHYEEILDDKTN